MSDLLRECGRKVFHMLSLVYLAAYFMIGYPAILAWLGAWSAVVVAVESSRLYLPGFNDFLFRLFRGLSRPEERGHYSGVFHTTIGALVLIVLFGARPSFVAAASPELATALYERVCERLGAARGRFGAHMEVELTGDGPVTIVLEVT